MPPDKTGSALAVSHSYPPPQFRWQVVFLVLSSIITVYITLTSAMRSVIKGDMSARTTRSG